MEYENKREEIQASPEESKRTPKEDTKHEITSRRANNEDTKYSAEKGGWDQYNINVTPYAYDEKRVTSIDNIVNEERNKTKCFYCKCIPVFPKSCEICNACYCRHHLGYLVYHNCEIIAKCNDSTENMIFCKTEMENEIQKLVKILSKVRQNLKVKLFSTFKKNNNPNLKAGELETVDLDHIMHFKTTVYSTIMGEIPDDYFDFEGNNSTSCDNESSQEEDNMYSYRSKLSRNSFKSTRKCCRRFLRQILFLIIIYIIIILLLYKNNLYSTYIRTKEFNVDDLSKEYCNNQMCFQNKFQNDMCTYEHKISITAIAPNIELIKESFKSKLEEFFNKFKRPRFIEKLYKQYSKVDQKCIRIAAYFANLVPKREQEASRNSSFFFNATHLT